MFDKGDRVSHEVLGVGTITDFKGGYVEVLWDKRPDVTYNTGVNPCLVFEKALSFLIEDAGDAEDGEDDDMDLIDVDGDSDSDCIKDEDLEDILDKFAKKYENGKGEIKK